MFRFLLMASLMLFLAACGSSPKTHFYVLNAEYVSDNISEKNVEGVGVGVWQVALPIMLDRSEIVTSSGPYGIELADFHKWAGALSSNMTQLIASELGRRLQSDRIVISPWSAYRKNDYQVKTHVERFYGEPGGEVLLSGAWSLLNAEGSKELTRQAFTFKTRASGKDYDDMVAALSKLTVQLSEQIANVIAAQKH